MIVDLSKKRVNYITWGLAPKSSNNFVAGRWPFKAAQCIGELPASFNTSFPSCGIFFKRYSTISIYFRIYLLILLVLKKKYKSMGI